MISWLILAGMAMAAVAEVAAQIAEIGANIPIGIDPAPLPAAQRAQAEPHLARSFLDPGLVVTAFQAGRFGDDVGGAIGAGVALSRNGGLTWERQLVPFVAVGVDRGAFDRVSDPVLTVDRTNSILLALLGVRNPGSNEVGALVLSRAFASTNFSKPLTVFAAPNSQIFPDKEWLVLNPFAAAAHPDRLVVSFTDFSNGADSRNPIAVTHSDDGGVSWSLPQVISPDFCQASQSVFLPDGSLAVMYWDFVEPSSGANAIEIAVSKDGGDSFNPPRRVTLVSVQQDPVARDAWFAPSLAADRQAGVLFIAYQGRDTGPRIFFTRSIDRGATWSAPRAVNDAITRSVFNPAIAASPDGQHVTVVFYDKRNASDDFHVDLYLAESFDGGDHWEPNVRLSEVSSDLRLAPLNPAGRMLGDYEGLVPSLNLSTPGVAVWIDTRSGNPEPFSAQIRRLRGTSYSAWARLRFNEAQLQTPAISGQGADPDGDGIPNLFEYILGLEPFHADPNRGGRFAVETTSAGQFQIAYERLALLADIDLFWEQSTDLAHWMAVIPLAENAVAGSTPWFERITDMFAPGLAGRVFFRLRARKK